MSARKLSHPRTWIEISSRAVEKNIRLFRALIGSRVKLWAVVKSNAYGHGIYAFSRLAERLGVDGFCVDSIMEAIRLREHGIARFILVIGATPEEYFPRAEREGIAVSVSTMEDLATLAKMSKPPVFHLKIDTGMHRRGFYVEDLPRVIRALRGSKRLGGALRGLYTHFASAKDTNYPTFTDLQFRKLLKAERMLFRAGFKRLTVHAAATGGALIDKKYHRDAVRVGIGLYGLYPSKEIEAQLPRVVLTPALSWKTQIAEVKTAEAGEYVGYDLTERLIKDSKLAVLPVGYWHGFPRTLSSPAGEVLVKGRRAPVVGRVSMDLVVIDVTGIPCKIGDEVVLIGKSGKERLPAGHLAARAGTIHYELLTRLNPLIERRVL